MSDSNRLLTTAAAIAVIVCALIWGVVGVGLIAEESHRIAVSRSGIEQAPQAETEQERRYRLWAAATPRGIMERVETPTNRDCASDANCREQEDLRAQQSVALASNAILDWTRWQTFIAIASTALLWWGLLLNRDATEHARVAAESSAEQAKVARDTFRAERRAWISIEDIQVAHIQNEGGFQVTLSIGLKNVGGSPAHEITVAPRCVLKFSRFDENRELSEMRAEAKEKHIRLAKFFGAERVLFPDREMRSGQITIGVPDREIKEAYPHDPPIYPVVVSIVGVVSYRSLQSEDVHTSGFHIMLCRANVDGLQSLPYGPNAPRLTPEDVGYIHANQGWFAD